MLNLIRMPKKRYDHVILEEPLIDISLEPTEEVDPLFIDPTSESVNNEIEDESALSGFSIFSPKIGDNTERKKLSITDKEIVKIKEEETEDSTPKVKDEPRDTDEEMEKSLEDEEPEVDPVQALAQALDKVEYLCPRCTFRSKEKEKVTQHIVSSHRIFQIGIPRPCDKCDYIAKTVRELSAHKKAIHPRTFVLDNLPTLATGEFKCPHCNFSSFHRNNVRSHMKVHTQDTVYTCDKCPYTAISRLNIETHAARHLTKYGKKWKFKCKHCGLMERTETLLQRHLILHGEGEMLKCQLCPYKSPYNHIISMHTRICHGIICKKSWDKEEKWKMRVRQSSRRCTRERRSYVEDKNDDINKDNFKEEFLELPIKKSRRGRKKKVCDNTEAKQESEVKVIEKSEDKSEHNTNDTVQEKTVEETPSPRRPTLEERLGRAREIINKNLSVKKVKVVTENDERDDRTESSSKSASENQYKGEDNHSDSDDEELSDDNSVIQSEEDEIESKEDEWTEEDSEFYPDTAEDSMQSYASDKAPSDLIHSASTRENENSVSDLDSLSKSESTTYRRLKGKNCRFISRKRVAQSIIDKNDNEKEPDQMDIPEKRLKKDSLDGSDIDYEQLNNDHEAGTNDNGNNPEQVVSSKTTELKNDPDNLGETDSVPAVLVLKRNGSSFTCIQKNNADSS